jgi:hypothetical protein
VIVQAARSVTVFAVLPVMRPVQQSEKSTALMLEVQQPGPLLAHAPKNASNGSSNRHQLFCCVYAVSPIVEKILVCPGFFCDRWLVSTALQSILSTETLVAEMRRLHPTPVCCYTGVFHYITQSIK